MSNKPKVFKAFVTSLVAFVMVSVVHFVVYLLCGLTIDLFLKIPVIGWLIDLLFFFRGDTPDMALSILSPIIAYFVTLGVQEKMNKETPTRGLSCVLLGILIILLHIVSLIINLIHGDGILKNVIQIIAGYVIFNGGISDLKELRNE